MKGSIQFMIVNMFILSSFIFLFEMGEASKILNKDLESETSTKSGAGVKNSKYKDCSRSCFAFHDLTMIEEAGALKVPDKTDMKSESESMELDAKGNVNHKKEMAKRLRRAAQTGALFKPKVLCMNEQIVAVLKYPKNQKARILSNSGCKFDLGSGQMEEQENKVSCHIGINQCGTKFRNGFYENDIYVEITETNSSSSASFQALPGGGYSWSSQSSSQSKTVIKKLTDQAAIGEGVMRHTFKVRCPHKKVFTMPKVPVVIQPPPTPCEVQAYTDEENSMDVLIRFQSIFTNRVYFGNTQLMVSSESSGMTLNEKCFRNIPKGNTMIVIEDIPAECGMRVVGKEMHCDMYLGPPKQKSTPCYRLVCPM